MSKESPPAILLDNVRFSYGGPEFRFDLEVAPGEIMALMGASGSGKSTLLHLVAGFEHPLSGRILLAGRDVARVPPASRPVTMVFQENNLFGHLTVAQNVGLGRRPDLRLRASDSEDVRRALHEVELHGKEDRLPAELSGGERQRVALARALLRDRPILLLDEPFASLGPALRHDMLDLVARITARSGMTVLMVTHSPQDAERIAGRIAFLHRGEVAEVGRTEDFLSARGPAIFRDYAGK